jgi:PAS domain S-box-containing protein
MFPRGQCPASLEAWEAGSPPANEPLWDALRQRRNVPRRLSCAQGVVPWRLRLVQGPGNDSILLCVSEMAAGGLRELRERTGILETIFHSLNEGVLAIDPGERIIAMSLSAERITGFAEEEVLGRSCHDVFQAPPGVECPFQTMLRKGKGFHQREMVLRGKGGRPIHVAVNATLLRSTEGAVEGAVVVLRDLSEVDRLREELAGGGESYGIVGQHNLVRKVIEKIETVAPSEASILIQGESGTGKELVAKAIHKVSPRRGGPFVKVNCAALAESLLESELFGHVRGAFTGAVKDRSGRFEAADGGTLFLDEIGETSQALQVKLLRVLQEGEYERVGESRTRKADVRIVAATNRDLRREVARGRFRDDLFFRLCVVPIDVAPLRERADDIPLLVDHFLKRLATREGRRKILAPSAYRALQKYSWPGNVRELENALSHAFVCSGGDIITAESLPEHVLHSETLFSEEDPRQEERRIILDALQAAGWNKGRAAEILKLSRTTLWRRMRDLDILDRRRAARA